MFKFWALFSMSLFLAIIAKGQFISPSGNSNIDLIDINRLVTLNVPLKVDDKVLLKYDFPPVYPPLVQVGTNSAKQFGNAITWSLSKIPFPVLTLSIKSDSLSSLGTYQVTIPYTSTINGTLTFNLVRSPAVLETPGSVTIDPVKSDMVILHEIGWKTSIRDLKFNYSLPGFNQKGLFCWDAGSNLLDAGEQKQFCYHLDPDVYANLPLGPNKGTLFVESKFFTTPVPIALTITRRLPKIWIIVMVLGGLIAGFFVKQVLAANIANEGVRVTGLQLIADIMGFINGINDQEVKDALAIFIQQAKAIIDSADMIISPSPTTAMADLQTIRNNFNTAKQQFLDSRRQNITILNNLNTAFNNKNLSTTLIMYLHDANSLLGVANKQLDDYNVNDAQATIQQINNAADAGVTNYKTYFSSFINFLITQSNYPTKATGTFNVISGVANGLQGLLILVVYDPVNPSVSISKLNDIQKSFSTVPDQLTTNILDDFKNDRGFDAPQSFNDALQQWGAVIVQMIINDNNLPNATGYPIKSELNNLIEAWGAAQNTEEHTIEFVTEKSSRNDLLIDEFTGTIDPGHPGPLSFKDKNFNETRVQQFLAQSKDRLRNFSILQSVLLMILIGAGAYSSLQANFIGYPTEFISIFLLAFSLDITAATVGQFKAKIS